MMQKLFYVIVIGLVSLLLVSCGQDTKSNSTQKSTPANSASTNIDSKDILVSLTSTEVTKFSERNNFVPDPERILDYSNLMDEMGTFPCIQAAQETTPMTWDKPNGWFAWCEVNKDGFRVSDKIPLPSGIPEKGMQIASVARDGDSLLYVITGAVDETAESNWYLAFYDGTTSRIVAKSAEQIIKSIATPSEPRYLDLCGGKAYWLTFDMTSRYKNAGPVGVLVKSSLDGTSTPEVVARKITAFSLDNNCNLATYSEYATSESAATAKTATSKPVSIMDIYRGDSKVKSIASDYVSSRPYYNDSIIAYTSSKNSKTDLVVYDISKDSSTVITDIPGFNTDYELFGIGKDFLYFSTQINSTLEITGYLYDVNAKQIYKFDGSFVGFTQVPNSNCDGKENCLLVSQSRPEYTIPENQKDSGKIFNSRQSYSYWSPTD